MNGETIFTIVWAIIMISILVKFYLDGKRALSIFPDIKSVEVVFREKTASGNSTKDWKTKFGGANNSLDIIVTDKELWLKSILLFAGIAKKFNLLHKIPLTNIVKAHKEGKTIILDFKVENEEKHQVILKIKNPEKFLTAIKI